MTDDDISSGQAADHESALTKAFPEDLLDSYEIHSYRGGASILSSNFAAEFNEIVTALRAFRITTDMIRKPGGNKGPIAKHFETLLTPQDGWNEAQITADLHVKLHHARRPQQIIERYIRNKFLDGHRIDFVKGKVALDFEWNSKDQTYDRDLYAFSAFHNAGAIDVGVLVTRSSSMDNSYFRSLGTVLKDDGTEGTTPVLSKFGASTTWMGKLLYRLDAGRNGGCPVVAIGITPDRVDQSNPLPL